MDDSSNNHIVLKTEEKSLCDIHERMIKLLQDHSPISRALLQDVVDYYNNVIRCMPGNVYWMNRDCRTVGCNQNVLDMFRLKSSEDFYGLSFEQMAEIGGWNQNQAESFKRDTLEVIESALPKANVEEPPIPGPDGKDIYFLSTRVPLLNKNSEVVGIVGISTDITHRKKMEIQLEQSKKLAESANKAKSEFLANMSHDIRTPLAGIIGVAEDMIETNLNISEMKQSAGELVQSSKRLLNLLNEILELTQIEQGDFLGESAVFEPKGTVEAVTELLTPSVKEKGLELKLNYDTRIPNTLIGQRILLHRILLNLLGNAIKFTKRGFVEINVHLAAEETNYASLVFQIKDTGVGIPKNKQSQIFDPFSRLTPSYDGVYKGTGLGLRIVKQFIEAMDGSITVESEENKGSSFTCNIPFRKTDHTQQESIRTIKPSTILKTSTLKHPSCSGRVLIIEDDEIGQKVALSKLNKLYKHIDIASTGEEAINKLQTETYDLAYLDIGLPDILGTEVAKRFRDWEHLHQRTQTPLIALTAHVSQHNTKLCLENGINTVLSKPLTWEAAEALHQLYRAKTHPVTEEENLEI